MGSFPGHLLPGCFFISFGIWWLIQITRRIAICSHHTATIPYFTTASYPCLCGKFLRWPIESGIKILATSIGIIAELYAAYGYGSSTKVVSYGDLQHVTMYSFFCLAGITEILNMKTNLPKGLDFIANSLAFAIEGLLFKFHLHGRKELDTFLHILLLYPIMCCCIAPLIELTWKSSVLAAYARSYFTILQGTWFIQIGFILYNPIPGSTKWKGDDHNEILLVAMMFAWHSGLVLVGMLLLHYFLHKIIFMKCCEVIPNDTEYEVCMEMATSSGVNRQPETRYSLVVDDFNQNLLTHEEGV